MHASARVSTKIRLLQIHSTMSREVGIGNAGLRPPPGCPARCRLHYNRGLRGRLLHRLALLLAALLLLLLGALGLPALRLAGEVELLQLDLHEVKVVAREVPDLPCRERLEDEPGKGKRFQDREVGVPEVNQVFQPARVAGLDKAGAFVAVKGLDRPLQKLVLDDVHDHNALDANELHGGAPGAQDLLGGGVQDPEAVACHQARDLQHPSVEQVDLLSSVRVQRQGGPHHEGSQNHAGIGILPDHQRDPQQVQRCQVVLPHARPPAAAQRRCTEVLLRALSLQGLRDHRGVAWELLQVLDGPRVLWVLTAAGAPLVEREALDGEEHEEDGAEGADGDRLELALHQMAKHPRARAEEVEEGKEAEDHGEADHARVVAPLQADGRLPQLRGVGARDEESGRQSDGSSAPNDDHPHRHVLEARLEEDIHRGAQAQPLHLGHRLVHHGLWTSGRGEGEWSRRRP
mmetsp:Transcript_30327/g.82105  ORF Transcript_30327/g.82105 Transcript_30327/m.82105 type:complete len:460 (-) Transcript_30327:14-1393(-)